MYDWEGNEIVTLYDVLDVYQIILATRIASCRMVTNFVFLSSDEGRETRVRETQRGMAWCGVRRGGLLLGFPFGAQPLGVTLVANRGAGQSGEGVTRRSRQSRPGCVGVYKGALGRLFC